MIENKKKKFILICGIWSLIFVMVGVSIAFFNYTRTGTSNTLSVGRVAFRSTQNNTISLTNVFPTDSNHLNNNNSATVTINIIGDTTYSDGIEYKVSIVDVHNTVNGKEIPINYSVSASNLGTPSNDYYNARGSTTNVYNLVEGGEASDNELILLGYIKSDNVGVNGSIDITAYLDKEKVGISDTVSRIENNNLVYGETGGDWIAGRTILTTSEWNNVVGSNSLSFRVKVEANEGIWIDEPQYIVMKNLNSIQSWTNMRDNITSIEFHKDGLAPSSYLDSFDATDLTSNGEVTVYKVDDGFGNNTFKAVIVGDGTIYAPEDSSNLFYDCTKMTIFNSENFRVDNVMNMYRLFCNCPKLVNIDTLSTWNTKNVENMNSIFINCRLLSNFDAISKWNTANVEDMGLMFAMTGIVNVDFVLNWDTSSLTTASQLFRGCANLTNVNGLINWNTSSLTNMYGMFWECTNLQNADGLKNWNTSSATNIAYMFNKCSNLTSVDLSSWNMSNLNSNEAMFQATLKLQTIKMPNNYTRIDDFMFNHNANYDGESFIIPKTVTSIGNSHIFYNFGKDNTFKKFVVESGSTSLKTIDDVLYTYDGTRLISIPRGKTFANSTYEIPEGVTFLNELSFSRNQNIDTVVLPNSYVIERYIEADNNNYGFINSGNSLSVAVYLYTSVKEYRVKDDNTRYMSYEGCIYSKDGTELIAVPLHYTGVLNIKAGTTTIGQEAFWVDLKDYIDSITQINIPVTVTTIEANQLSLLNTLMSRSTNRVTITIDAGNTAYHIVNNQIVAI